MFRKKENTAKLDWKDVKSSGIMTRTRRAKVPGGWLVAIEISNGIGLTFYPDSEHKWEVENVF